MPFDNIKTWMQSTIESYDGMLDCARKTLRKNGITAFWKGTTPRLVRLIVSIGAAA
jgi:solute carrier family 25 (mitochondrial citrate transporter), member 1